MDFTKVEKMISEYEGPKVGFIVSGGGAGIANLATVPGASKIIHEIKIPYSLEAVENFLSVVEVGRQGFYSKDAVSQDSALLLAEAARRSWGDNIKIIACTAAITTNRWRRGDNHAWICVINPATSETSGKRFYNAKERTKSFHFELSKLTEEEYATAGGFVSWKRRNEDNEISDFLLNQAFSIGE